MTFHEISYIWFYAAQLCSTSVRLLPQNTLLSIFPREAGKYDRLDRCIPFLPTADNVLQFLGGNFSAKLLESRLRTINYYCETILLKLGPHLSRSHYVLQFFQCQPGDEQRLE